MVKQILILTFLRKRSHKSSRPLRGGGGGEGVSLWLGPARKRNVFGAVGWGSEEIGGGGEKGQPSKK